ncbi:Histone chaperone asf1 [Naganishia vaughanmartiniae]|uniref:Histone chaperone asf1 n=1 Tax=Naganishia vaughanmartiniae TaxID=1424756 RepID=A0ACC2X9Q8_9TREE|nr:Histone chaperone asf1 [Naganishia vaughanmartiniae]
MVGPVPVGVNSFDFTAAAPQPTLLPSTSSEEILGVTVLILTASYRDKEFVRVGYYVNTEYEDEERRLEPPPVVTDFKSLIRNVLVDKPKVTRSVLQNFLLLYASELIV